jgi:biopolymer transport protein ExbB
MKHILTGILLALAPALSAQAPVTVPAALEKAKTELKSTLADLDEARDTIAKEKPALAAAFAETDLELREKRRLVRLARMTREDRETEMRQLDRDRTVRRQDADFLAGLLKDHALKNTTLAGPGEPALDLDPAILAGSNADPATALRDRLAILDASLAQLESLLGGSTAKGDAALPGGEITSGTFIGAGPLTWFIAGDSKTAGEVASSKSPGVPRLHPENPDTVKILLDGGEVMLGVDVTGGSARVLEEIDGGFLDLIRKGGLWVWPIMLLALLSLIFGLIKLAQFTRIREPGEAWINAILAAIRVGDQQKARSLASEARHPAATVINKLIEVSDNPADLVEETLYEQLMGVQTKAGSMLPFIAVTAATSPLLGLLGTVSGMIATFNLITLFGSGDPKPLAGGISEALITTLFGLVVAIPALVRHAFLSRRSQGIVQTTEQLGLSFINGLRVKS